MMSTEVPRPEEPTWKKCYVGEEGRGAIAAGARAVDARPIALSFPIRMCQAVNEENTMKSRTRCRSAKWSFGATRADDLSLGAA